MASSSMCKLYKTAEKLWILSLFVVSIAFPRSLFAFIGLCRFTTKKIAKIIKNSIKLANFLFFLLFGFENQWSRCSVGRWQVA